MLCHRIHNVIVTIFELVELHFYYAKLTLKYDYYITYFTLINDVFRSTGH